MKIKEKIFDSVLLLEPDVREDSRGTMAELLVEDIKVLYYDKNTN